MITAGPARPSPSPTTTKIPVPMMAPTRRAVRLTGPTARFSSWPLSWVSSTREPTGRMWNKCSLVNRGIQASLVAPREMIKLLRI